MKNNYPTIGFIGLGALGEALAEQILDAAGALYVWNRTQEKCAAIAQKGATTSPDIPSLVASCDWIFSCLTDDEALEAVSSAVHEASAPGKTYISMTTATPHAVQKIASDAAQAGTKFLNCPVMGRPDTVRIGRAGFLLAGEAAAAQAITPLLSQMGTTPIYIGTQPADAASYKLAINYYTAVSIAGMTEAFASIETQGLNTEKFFNVLSNGPAGSSLMKMFGDLILSSDKSAPLFQMHLARKDMLYFKEASGADAKLYALEGILQHLDHSIKLGHENDDWSDFAAHLLHN